MFNGRPLKTIEHTPTLFGQMFYYFFINVHEKCIFYHLKICLSTFLLILSINIIVYIREFWCMLRYNKVFLDENPKRGFLGMKQLQKATKNVLLKFFVEWFSITTIDPIHFMKMLWSNSANWCFQKLIGYGLALRWSNTTQFKVFTIQFTICLNHYLVCFLLFNDTLTNFQIESQDCYPT